mmetsp:Transcript_13600/g.21426  ORF Transcript_13600/g.21426 Transcript_13600/m.21426 type:complete len:144 (-) Transcript_13600:322-753(-)
MPDTAKPAANIMPERAAPKLFVESTAGATKAGKARDPITRALAKGDAVGSVDLCNMSVKIDQERKGDVKYRVMIEVPVKVQTAKRDRGLSRPSPQIPCPVVHPFPIFVPTPTKNPPSKCPINDGMGTSVSVDRESCKATSGVK